jgi:hypothetical protein
MSGAAALILATAAMEEECEDASAQASQRSGDESANDVFQQCANILDAARAQVHTLMSVYYGQD